MKKVSLLIASLVLMFAVFLMPAPSYAQTADTCNLASISLDMTPGQSAHYEFVVPAGGEIGVFFYYPGGSIGETVSLQIFASGNSVPVANTLNSLMAPAAISTGHKFSFETLAFIDAAYFDGGIVGGPIALLSINLIGGCPVTDNRIPGLESDSALYVLPDGSVYYYRVNAEGDGILEFYLSAEELESYPADSDGPLYLSTDGKVALYRLSSGEFQLNVGPNFEGKVREIIFVPKPFRVNKRGEFSVFGSVR